MPSRKVIILGSSRRKGDTEVIIDQLLKKSDWELIDLNDYNVTYFDYEHKNVGDDYLPLIRRIIAGYQVMIFATPVYWYSMSGIMKVFFDRFADLLEIEKELGRQLRGKKMAAISSSIGNNLGDAFWLPFRETARYLGMEYLGDLHSIVNHPNSLSPEEARRIEQFVQMIDEKAGE